ncbi:host specificity factor TipJ family phage tail protein [Nitrobacteraceae bacterium UC4446_H13]
MSKALQVIALPHLDPAKRIDVTVPEGLTVAQIVATALPDLPVSLADSVRVTVDDWLVPRALYAAIRPKPGHLVTIRVVPGDANLRTVLSLAVTVAAVAAGQFYLGPALASAVVPAGFAPTAATLSVTGAVSSAALMIGGSLLVNALIPIRPANDEQRKSLNQLSGLRNVANPNGPVPAILGTMRYAPPFAATTYTQIIDDDQYLIASFNFGHGPIAFSDIKLGDTPIENFQDVELELRNGVPGEPPLKLYREQVLEEALSVELRYNEANSRLTARDIQRFSIDLVFPQGTAAFDDEGKMEDLRVAFQISYRLVGTNPWTTTGFSVLGKTQNAYRRSFEFGLPVRGQYEVELIRLTENLDDPSDAKKVGRSDWMTLRGFRPEYPINFEFPVALAAIRIRASGQLNGVIDNFNAICSLRTRQFDGSSWNADRPTSNPADLFRHVLQSRASAYPEIDDNINLPALQDWANYCRAKGLTYNRVHDYDAGLNEVLADIAAAGRALPHDLGGKWSVIIDRPRTQTSALITPRNSWGLSGERQFQKYPDAFRVQFVDAANGYQNAEQIVPWPDFEGDPIVTQDLPMQGKTDATEVYREARRRQYEVMLRQETFTVNQDFEALAVTRGDMVTVSHYVLSSMGAAGRVVSVNGRMIVLDEPVTMAADRYYGIRVRKANSDPAEIVTLPIKTVEGEHHQIIVAVSASGIAADDLVIFGEIDEIGEECIVKDVEVAEHLTARLTLIPHAPEIEDLTEGRRPPSWDGRPSRPIPPVPTAPLVPIITSVAMGDGGVVVTLTRGAGSGAVPTAYVVAHRLPLAAFSEVEIPAGSGAVTLTGYEAGDLIEVKAKAIAGSEESGFSDVVTYLVHIGPSLDSTLITFDSEVYKMDAV